MKYNIKNLKGSKHNDEFKYQHKQRENYENDELYEKAYACDIDLIEVRNDKIVCFWDIKKNKERLTQIEKIIYLQLVQIAPFFIVFCDNWDKENSHIKVVLFKLTEKNKYVLEKVVEFNNRKIFFSRFVSNIENIIKRLELEF